MASNFTHLHVHSHYSLLEALPKIPDLVKKAKEYGMTALALTDNGNLYGAIEFYKECKKAELKPIIGIDAYVALRTRHDKQSGVDNRRSRLVLLAKNVNGYKNLIKLVTTGYVEGFYYKPRIDRELLEQNNKDLIAIIPSFSGEVSQALKMQDTEKAREVLSFYKKTFGEENVFLEITRHAEIAGHNEHMEKIVAFARETNTQLVAAHDVYYMSPEDKRARDTLMSIQSGKDLSDKSGFGEEEDNFSFISPTQAEELFADIPDALENTQKIADMVSIDIPLGKWVFPNYIVPSGRSYDDELRARVFEGIEKRKLEKTKELEDRVEYELKVIKDKGYSPYFLVVSDLLEYAHSHHILTTIRGSVAGSLVTYLAGITNVNPLEYKLPFERFLNPERPSAPDIDMDYADNRRDEMIQYAKDKYGADKVAQIGTFGTMMARGSVRDVTRALGHPYALGDSIAKLIPMGSQGFPMTIDTAFEETPELKEMYKKSPEVRDIIDMAKKIEGCARHISVHAAGVVISPSTLTDFVPLQIDTKGSGNIITQYDMHAVEDAGLLKFDFLGIKNLAILADAVTLVKKLEGKDIDIENIPLDDKKTFSILARGETIGLFQLNGSGMTNFLKQLKPSSIHDINAMVALYRPGPIETIPQYIERKHNPALVTYEDPRMKEYLEFSNGLLVYQDDVMLTSIKLAGYSWLEADKLRKAMGKKIPAEMEAQKGKLIEGFVKNGLSQQKSEKLWKLIEPFAAYGFNKAHAASYGRVAYQTAYMKANFPAIYMSAVLTADSGDVEKIAETIAECKRMGIEVLAPDINESFGGFTVIKNEEDRSKDKIRFGLTTIKNFGEGIGTSIIAERKKNGPFKTISDFLNRIKDKNLNKKSLEALIKSGAMDAFGERGVMIANIEILLAHNKEQSKATSGQDSLFGGMADSSLNEVRLNPAPPATEDEKLAWEKELLGLYISGHPLNKHKEKLASAQMKIEDIKNNLPAGITAVVYGMLEEIRPIATKKGDTMCFIKIRDFTGVIEAVVFPKSFEEYKDLIVQDACIGIKGRVTERNGEKSVVVEKMKKL